MKPLNCKPCPSHSKWLAVCAYVLRHEASSMQAQWHTTSAHKHTHSLDSRNSIRSCIVRSFPRLILQMLHISASVAMHSIRCSLSMYMRRIHENRLWPKLRPFVHNVTRNTKKKEEVRSKTQAAWIHNTMPSIVHAFAHLIYLLVGSFWIFFACVSHSFGYVSTGLSSISCAGQIFVQSPQYVLIRAFSIHLI